MRPDQDLGSRFRLRRYAMEQDNKYAARTRRARDENVLGTRLTKAREGRSHRIPTARGTDGPWPLHRRREVQARGIKGILSCSSRTHSRSRRVSQSLRHSSQHRITRSCAEAPFSFDSCGPKQRHLAFPSHLFHSIALLSILRTSGSA